MNDYYSKLNDYYNSSSWANKRSKRLKIDGFKCAKCGFTRALEVHHINYERLGHEDVSRDLITLCKKCHNEIEEQKKVLNPIKKEIEHHSVYLAGKIHKNGWRTSYGTISPEYESVELLASEFEYDVNDEMTVTGPVFIECDHGCYHGTGSHGVGADGWGCGGHEICREDVLYICKSQIDRAEILFAYIDCTDCYGTIAEIGYAHANDKDIIIVFNNEELREEMWFVDKMQRNTGIASHEWMKKHLISKLKEENKDESI